MRKLPRRVVTLLGFRTLQRLGFIFTFIDIDIDVLSLNILILKDVVKEHALL